MVVPSQYFNLERLECNLQEFYLCTDLASINFIVYSLPPTTLYHVFHNYLFILVLSFNAFLL